MNGTLEVLDPTGHVTLTWDPNDPDAVRTAEDEFERLKTAGFAFFVNDAETDALGESGTLDVRPAAAQTLRRRGRTVAVRPMVGG
jgi:hypothetical protein